MTLARENIVSSDSEMLILVDPDDRQTGVLSKGACHDGNGVLHRAFSVFLFDDRGRLLLQQRAAGKRLWPKYWTNTCCSHPREGESMTLATERRLREELDTRSELEFVYKFEYQAQFQDRGSEHELCSVYLGRLLEPPSPNDTEIAAVRFVSAGDLHAEIASEPERFTPWLKLEWGRLNDEFAGRLAKYTAGDA